MTLKPYTGVGSDSVWIKSSYSTDEGPDCVEVAATPAHILVRDSKNPQGPRLALTAATWSTFLSYASER